MVHAVLDIFFWLSLPVLGVRGKHQFLTGVLQLVVKLHHSIFSFDFGVLLLLRLALALQTVQDCFLVKLWFVAPGNQFQRRIVGIVAAHNDVPFIQQIWLVKGHE